MLSPYGNSEISGETRTSRAVSLDIIKPISFIMAESVTDFKKALELTGKDQSTTSRLTISACGFRQTMKHGTLTKKKLKEYEAVIATL